MRTARFLSAVVAAAVFATACLAADVVGKWTGKMTFENDKGVAVDMKMQGASLPTLNLELKADKTYAGSQTGGPGNTKINTEGTWKLNGNTLTLNPTKRDGKPTTGEGAKPRIYTLSKDGKSLTIDLTARMKAAVQASGQTKAPALKAKLVLHRAK